MTPAVDLSAAAASSWWSRLRTPAPRLNLALQGGGAHGAFTWGVLDALLDAPQLGFEGLSGSSAGAMNAVVFADGWMKGGRDGARAALAEFWSAVGQQMPPGALVPVEGGAVLAPATKMLAAWLTLFAPMQFNPFDLNPLRDLLKRQVDFDGLRAHSPFKLFVGATVATSGRLRIFREHELTLDMLLASACLPKLHHAVEIDGVPYWDGGFSANPAVFPLFYECDSRDLLLVLLAPLEREDMPHTVEAIEARIAELAFSTHFLREMRMFAQARAFAHPTLLRFGRLERRLQQMRFHMIDSSALPALARTDTKALAYGPFLDELRALGHERGAAWLAADAPAVGRHSSIDLDARFA
jgi:NTE family protein